MLCEMVEMQKCFWGIVLSIIPIKLKENFMRQLHNQPCMHFRLQQQACDYNSRQVKKHVQEKNDPKKIMVKWISENIKR